MATARGIAAETGKLVSLGLWLAGWSMLVAACCDCTIRYFYDDAGRLLAVTDPAVTAMPGGTAIYSYDAAGNITKIKRQPASQPSIMNFRPKCVTAPQGASVTIDGTGFSPTATDNVVTFPGNAQSTATSATAYQLVVPVPSGSTGTAPLSVKVGTGTPVSSAPNVTFTVGACGLPVITDFTVCPGPCAQPKIGLPGALVTITGTGFDPIASSDKVFFNVPAGAAAVTNPASATSVTTKIPNTGSSGHITLATPVGSTTSTADFFIPPNSNCGLLGYPPCHTVAEVAATGRLPVSFAGQPPSSPQYFIPSHSVVLVVFDATAGQRVSFSETPGAAAMYIINPDQTLLTQGKGFIEPESMPTTGTYAAMLSFDSGSGTETVTFYDVWDDFSHPINPTPQGASDTVIINTPGQNGELTFTGQSGHAVSAKVSPGWSIPGCWKFSIKTADQAQTLVSSNPCLNGTFLDRAQVESGANYFVGVNPAATDTGQATITVYDVVDVIAGTTIGGSIPITITTPAQNAYVLFTATQNNQPISVKVFGNMCFAELRLLSGSVFGCSTSSAPLTVSATVPGLAPNGRTPHKWA